MRCDRGFLHSPQHRLRFPRLVRKLAAYPRQNQVARALTELGKLERTAFLLEYFRDESLRRRILIGLNKGEALHALARQRFFGRLGELRDRALEDQMHRASCLHLLMAAIAAWNTIYLTEAFATLRRRGKEISETTVGISLRWAGSTSTSLGTIISLLNQGVRWRISDHCAWAS